MNTEDLIPKFEPGEKVIVNCQYYEWVCPICGEISGKSRDGKIRPGDILQGFISDYEFESMMTGCCHSQVPMPYGFIQVEVPDHHSIYSIPYTLLERVNASPLSKGQER